VGDEPNGSPDGLFVIGTIGRLTAVKDQASLIRAFAQLRHYVSEGRFAQLRLVIIGSGPLAAELHETAESLGIGEQIWLAGVREDIEIQLGRFDLFVLPSLAEGVPVTVLEAMACARPVVASAVGGVPELVVDGSTGTLVPAADPQSLARALAGYVDDPQLCRRHGQAGRERVLEHFSLERMVDDYQNLYIELLSNARTPPRASSAEYEYACRAEETRHGPRVSGREG
jgi:glycosyltransferase involved in cell wall biosynthesis